MLGFGPLVLSSSLSSSQSSWRPLVLAATLFAGALAIAPVTPVAARNLPGSLSDKAFWQLVTQASEVGGTFASNNWISNELAFQTVLPELTRRVAKGGVYVGVGPDQNFTYIVGLRPQIAFIVDIRRQNLLQHLLFKALIELSPTRSEFLSRLFSRPRAPGADAGSTAAALLAFSADQTPDEKLFEKTLADMMANLTETHGFALSPDDRRTVEYIYQTFVEHGPDITYSPMPARFGPSGAFGGGTVRTVTSQYPTFAELMTETDGLGVNRAYLATEDSYRVLREMQRKNLIVPVVGDFGGEKALRTVGRWIRDHGAKVTTFYTSNVEQYLFQNNVWREYYDNVASMPIDKSSTFIRSFFPSQFRGRGPVTFGGMPGTSAIPSLPPSAALMRLPSATLLCSIADLLAAVKTGQITNYFDVIEMSK